MEICISRFFRVSSLEWTDFVQSDAQVFGIAGGGGLESDGLEAEVWSETMVTEGGRRFKVAWSKEEIKRL